MSLGLNRNSVAESFDVRIRVGKDLSSKTPNRAAGTPVHGFPVTQSRTGITRGSGTVTAASQDLGTMVQSREPVYDSLASLATLLLVTLLGPSCWLCNDMLDRLFDPMGFKVIVRLKT